MPANTLTTNSALQPYRQLAIVPLVNKITSGLIINAKNAHICNLPFRHWCNRIFGVGARLKHGSLWRCECGKVFVWKANHPNDYNGTYNICYPSPYPKWEESTDSAWLESGGEL